MLENNIYQKEFVPYVVRYGKVLNTIGCFLVFVPCIVLLVVGFKPNWQGVLGGIILTISGSGVLFIVEPISYFTTLGIPGTYMSFLSGNIANMRVPCALVSQEAGGETPGTDRGSILATVGIAVSIVVCLVVLTIGAIAGNQIYAILPESVKSAFNLLLPALFASMMANIVMSNLKVAKFGLPLCVLMVVLYKTGMLSFIPAAFQTAVVLLVSIFGTIALSMKFIKEES